MYTSSVGKKTCGQTRFNNAGMKVRSCCFSQNGLILSIVSMIVSYSSLAIIKHDIESYYGTR